MYLHNICEAFGDECLSELIENLPLSELYSSHGQDDGNVDINTICDAIASRC